MPVLIGSSRRIARRYPHQVGKDIAKGINAGRIEFADKHLSMFPQDLTYGYYSLKKKHGDPKKPLDWAVIEATAITEDGWIVPGASVGASPEILQCAEKIIIEVNTRIPNLEGLHDINQSFGPPHRQPYVRVFSPLPFHDLPRIISMFSRRNFVDSTCFAPS